MLKHAYQLAAESLMSVKQVLVVDDDPVQRFIALKQLKILGMETQSATNGKEAVALTSQHKFDLILMDVQMPVMDGLEATHKIREQNGGSAIPIVAFTANPNRNMCFEAGMSDYLFKPVMISELKRILGRWMPSSPPTSSS